MPSRLRTLVLLAPAVLAALALGACGNSHTKVTTGTYAGESGAAAPYLNVGPLIYQVQLSRQLNPTNSEDAAYLQGVSPAQGKLEAGEEWFAVFMQVYNNTSASHRAAEGITISDTQGNTYTPIVPAETNSYAYRGGSVAAKEVAPPQDTPAFFGPTQGSLLLYKIKVASLDNRPLEVKISNPEDTAETASAELDV
jgi:hypothetical protein